MKRTPVFSVVIAAYNAERWIAQTLDSVARQTFKDFELIFVDGGSTDATAAIARAHPVVAKCIIHPNCSQPAARNVGIRAAAGLYVAFVDADDLWLAKKLQRQMDLLATRSDLAWCYTDCYYFDDETGQNFSRASCTEPLVEGDILRPLLLECFIPSLTVVVRRDAFTKSGLFDEERGNPHEDWNMWLRLAGHFQVGVVPELLARCRVRKGSKGRGSSVHAWENGTYVIERALHDYPERLRGLRKSALARNYRRAAITALRNEEFTEAKRFAWGALRFRPWKADNLAMLLMSWTLEPALFCKGRALRRWYLRLASGV